MVSTKGSTKNHRSPHSQSRSLRVTHSSRTGEEGKDTQASSYRAGPGGQPWWTALVLLIQARLGSKTGLGAVRGGSRAECRPGWPLAVEIASSQTATHATTLWIGPGGQRGKVERSVD